MNLSIQNTLTLKGLVFVTRWLNYKISRWYIYNVHTALYSSTYLSYYYDQSWKQFVLAKSYTNSQQTFIVRNANSNIRLYDIKCKNLQCMLFQIQVVITTDSYNI